MLRELGIFGLSREMRDHGTLEDDNFVASVNDFAPLAEGTAAGMGQALQIVQSLPSNIEDVLVQEYVAAEVPVVPSIGSTDGEDDGDGEEEEEEEDLEAGDSDDEEEEEEKTAESAGDEDDDSLQVSRRTTH